MDVKVWVSYASKDKEYLQRLCKEVDEVDESFSIEWVSDRRLKTGDVYSQKIEDWIGEAHAWILLLSPAFERSNYSCRKELPLIQMEAKGKPYPRRLWPVLLDKYPERWELSQLTESSEGIHVLSKQQPILEKEEEVDRRWRLAAEELSKLIHSVMVKVHPEKRTQLKQFRPEIMKGEFVPFLGPCLCDLAEKREPALPHLRSRLRYLLSELDRDEDRPVKEFVLSVAASRRLSLNGFVANETESGGLPTGLLAMQVAVARLGAACCALFGEALGQRFQGVTDLRNYSVRMEPQDPLVGSLREALQYTIQMAEGVHHDSTCLRKTPTKSLCVGSSGIASKLEALREAVFGSHPETSRDKQEHSRTTGHEQQVKTEDLPGRSGRMMLSHLEWVSNLLWHTIRFDSPVLPSPDDLSFQLSLCQCSPECIIKAPLSTIAAIWESHKCLSLIVGHFDNLASGKSTTRHQSSTTAIHEWKPAQGTQEPLAAILARMLKLTCESRVSTNAEGQTEGSALTAVEVDERHAEHGPQPLLLTANMDLDIERELEILEGPYFLLFPINYQEEGDADPSPGWMLTGVLNRTSRHYYLDANATFEELARKVNPRYGGTSSRRLSGPLVIHLRGAPLADLPKPDVGDFEQILRSEGERHELGGGTKFCHRILLSCLDFSRQLVGIQGLPQVVHDLIGKDRVLFFVGHVLNEPDGLLGLQTDVWVRRCHDLRRTAARGRNDSERQMNIACCSADDVHTAMLRRMNVTPLPITLDEVGHELVKAFEERTDEY